ncbi:MAG: succinate dehydrogenase assembly factor 2 [Cucumibacter sp.]
MTDVTGKSLGPRQKRALFRARHRGTSEMDLILGGFAEARIAGFDAAMLDRFEALMDLPEPDLYAWITGQAKPPADADRALIGAIAEYCETGARR